MRIGLVTSNVDGVGGVETFNGMIRRLVESRGHTFDIYGVQSLKKRDLILPIELQVGNHFNYIHSKKPYDLVLCNGEYGCGVEHPRAINIFHGNFAGYANSVKGMVSEDLTKSRLSKISLQVDAVRDKYVVAVSESCKRELIELQGIDVDSVIPLTVDTNYFKPIEDIKVRTYSLAVCRGRFYEKGFDILLDLAQRGVRIDLYSDNKIDSENVINHGFLEHSSLPIQYNQARIFVSPSRFEGGGLTNLEAMACGTPVITTRTGYGYDIQRDIPEFVAENNGEFFAKHFVVSNNRTKYSKLSGEFFWDNFCPEKFKNGWVELIEGI